MKELKIAVCDDDKTALEIITAATKTAFNKNSFTPNVSAFLKVSYLERAMKDIQFDLLLLDIDMPETDGIAFAEKLRAQKNHIEIIFISSREDKVFEALKVHPFGFVRKSYFIKDISSIADSFIMSVSLDNEQTLTIQTKEKTVSLAVSDIKYIEGDRSWQNIYQKDNAEPVRSYSTMEKYESALKKEGFLRIHKGYLVNYRFIRLIGGTDVILITGEKIPVSRRKIQECRAAYLELIQSHSALLF